MEISILNEVTYKGSSNVPAEEGIKYVPCNDDYAGSPGDFYARFIKGDEYYDSKSVYERSGDTLDVYVYDSANDDSYAIGDVVFDSSSTQKCLSYVAVLGGATVAKQPEDYDDVPTHMNLGSWDCRYAHIGTLVDGEWSSSDLGNQVVHSLHWDGTRWKYRFTRWTTVRCGCAAKYSYGDETGIPDTYLESKLLDDGDCLQVLYWEGTKLHQEVLSGGFQPIPQYSTFYEDAGARTTYNCGDVYEGDGTTYERYYVYQVITREELRNHDSYPKVTSSSSLEVSEALAAPVYVVDQEHKWVPNHIILRGNEIYIRTDDDTKVQELTEITVPTFLPLHNLGDAPWGWTKIRPLNIYSPIDGKKSTAITSYMSPMWYEVEVEGFFDTVAVNGLIASLMTVRFIPNDGSDPIPDTLIIPDSKRDPEGLLPPYPTTSIVYAPRNITGSVRITLEAEGLGMTIGGISVGQSADAGFTNLVFQNAFEDYSPYEQDQWGNITRVEGVKTNLYEGTVDVELVNYDMTNRLMASIGGQTVILNGSDNKENAPVDNENFFASTMVVGRISNFRLRTKLDNKKLSQMATYSFSIEEDV